MIAAASQSQPSKIHLHLSGSELSGHSISDRTERVPGGKGTFYEYEGEGHAFMNAGKDVKEKMASAYSTLQQAYRHVHL